MPKRRANGEGSIFKRKDGLWAAQYTDNIGKKRTLYGKTQQIVREKLKQAIRESDNGLDMSKNVYFTDWLIRWFETYYKPNVNVSSYSQSYYLIYSHIVPHFPRVYLKDVRADMIQVFLNDRRNNGRIRNMKGLKKGDSLSDSTVSKMKNIISAALEYAVDNNMILKNVGKKVRVKKQRPLEKQVLTIDEQRRLEQAIESEKDDYWVFAILLALYTGLRVGELASLKITDIDFDKKELNVRRTKQRVSIRGTGKSKVIFNEPKTAKSRRTIPLPDFIIEALKDCINQRNLLVDTMDGNWIRIRKHDTEIKKWKDEGFIFLTMHGNPVDRTTLNAFLNKLLKKANAKEMNFHGLRHTFATRSIERGFDVKSLSEILGHADAKMTLNTYSHALSEQKRNNMNKHSPLFSQEENNEQSY